MLTRAPNQNLLSLRQTIGSAARTLRRSRSLTQEEVAASLGMSQAQLSMKERGETSFTAEQLIELMRLFNAPLHAFVPYRHVDHMHPNAVIALAACSDDSINGTTGICVRWLTSRQGNPTASCQTLCSMCSSPRARPACSRRCPRSWSTGSTS